MSEEIIEENGELKVRVAQAAPAPIVKHLALQLREITATMDRYEDELVLQQAKLDRICALLTDAQLATLSDPQLNILAARNASVQAYLLRR